LFDGKCIQKALFFFQHTNYFCLLDNRLYKETPKPKATKKTTSRKKKRAPAARRSSRKITRSSDVVAAAVEEEEEEEEKSEDEGEWIPWKLVK
jgi:hypothetical protein